MQYRQYSNTSNFFWIALVLFIFFGGFRLIFLLFSILIALIIGFFPLLLLGGILYLLFGRASLTAKLGGIASRRSAQHQQFLELLIRILVDFAKVDGHIDERELQVIRQYFRQSMQMDTAQLQWVDDLIAHAIKDSCNLDELCVPFRQQFPDTFSYIALELVYQVVYADGTCTKEEQRHVDRLVAALNIPVGIHEQIRANFVPSSSQKEKYYKILGCEPGASKDEIKKAYRAASKQYHPDKVMHLGDEFKKVAEEKMRAINEAYKELSR